MGLFRYCQVFFAQGSLVKTFSYPYWRILYMLKFTILQIVCIPVSLAHVINLPFLPISLYHFISSSFLFRSRKDVSVSLRCIKACQPNDFNCNLDPVHLITHTTLSLPTFRDISEPEGKTRWKYSKFLETAFRCVCLKVLNRGRGFLLVVMPKSWPLWS